MKTAILYYSMAGSTRRYAQGLAQERGARCCEVRPQKRYGLLGSFLRGCPAAIRQKSVALASPVPDVSECEAVILAAPVWAGFPAPPFNSMLQLLRPGQTVEVHLCSGSGQTPKCRRKVEEQIESRGCRLSAYRDIATEPQKDDK